MIQRLIVVFFLMNLGRMVFADETAQGAPDEASRLNEAPAGQEITNDSPSDPLPHEELAKIHEAAVLSLKTKSARLESLLASNEAVRVSADEVKNLRAARLAFVNDQPAVKEVAQKIEKAAARLREIGSKGVGGSPDETTEEARKLRREIISLSREKARLLKTPGAEGSELAELDRKLAEAEKGFETQLWKDPEMVRLIRAHNQNLETRMSLSAAIQPEDVPSAPVPGGVDPVIEPGLPRKAPPGAP